MVYLRAVDVALPIRTVVPSLDGPVLQVLASTTVPLSLTEIHRRAGDGSLSGVRKVLLRLVGTGIVDEVPGGYLMNRSHVAVDAVIALSRLAGELAERIRRHLAALDGVHMAGLVGSAARRDGDESSDIDVVVVVADHVARDAVRQRLAALIRKWTGNPAHVIILTADELQGVAPTTLASWRQDYQPLLGGDL